VRVWWRRLALCWCSVVVCIAMIARWRSRDCGSSLCVLPWWRIARPPLHVFVRSELSCRLRAAAPSLQLVLIVDDALSVCCVVLQAAEMLWTPRRRCDVRHTVTSSLS
jgi:hypothetical protein